MVVTTRYSVSFRILMQVISSISLDELTRHDKAWTSTPADTKQSQTHWPPFRFAGSIRHHPTNPVRYHSSMIGFCNKLFSLLMFQYMELLTSHQRSAQFPGIGDYQRVPAAHVLAEKALSHFTKGFNSLGSLKTKDRYGQSGLGFLKESLLTLRSQVEEAIAAGSIRKKDKRI
ncbi:hypothetical protein BDP27DRAFT_743915 [Rhodocollybia butyracea]|uniref:Uncharacterized protein n=1 Tax=Rhodocollybia butyracea TaxID=206335 RepID=A0A9P5PNF2_9AGAR|nr:hypothetical protein BDP27DRAFT_743915 [Rhodocollybia butyracea]